MPKFQVEVALSAGGYLTVEAADEKAARKLVESLDIGLDLLDAGDADCTMMPATVDIWIDGVVEEEEDECPNPS